MMVVLGWITVVGGGESLAVISGNFMGMFVQTSGSGSIENREMREIVWRSVRVWDLYPCIVDVLVEKSISISSLYLSVPSPPSQS
jgi:hypothetical protein